MKMEVEMEESPPMMVNLMGHCSICLVNLKETEGSECGGEGVREEALPKGGFPSEITNLRHIWPYLVEGEWKVAEMKGVNFVDGGESDNVEVTEIPPICKYCGDQVQELDRLHWELMRKVKDIKKIICDTGGGGSYHGRKERFGELLKNSHLQSGMIRNTFKFLEMLSGTVLEWIEDTDAVIPPPISPDLSVENPAETRSHDNNEDDWKLKAEAMVSLAPVIISSSSSVMLQNGNPTCGGKRKRGRPRKRKVPADYESEDLIKKEVILNEDPYFADTDMLHDEANLDFTADDDIKYEPEVKAEESHQHQAGSSKLANKYGVVTCEICNGKVSFPDIYEHLRSHVGDFAMKCPNSKCGYAYSNPNTMIRNHLKHKKPCMAAWKKLGGFVCDTCGFNQSTGVSFSAHLKLHETATKNVVCPLPRCDERFSVRQSVHVHIFQKHLSAKYRQKCTICEKLWSTNSPVEMEGHLKTQHQVKDEDIVKCQQCSYVLPDWESYLGHAFKHRYEGVPCYICKNNIKFLGYGPLRKHYFKEHLIGKRFVCEQCGLEVTTENALKLHVQIKHEGKTPEKRVKTLKFKCDVCSDGTAFHSEILLVGHKIRTHGMEPFACKVCHKTFNYLIDLNRHDRENHAAERGFEGKAKRTEWPCNLEGCTETFRTSKVRTFHRRKFHPGVDPKIKRLICEFCSKEFFRTNGLKRHRQIHLGTQEQHICDICGENFTSAYNLDRHKMIHSGERPFSCHLCGQTFRQKVVMEVHIKSHETLGDQFKPKGGMERRKRIKRNYSGHNVRQLNND